MVDYLLFDIETGLEVLYTGRNSPQYQKTAYILCDNYAELLAKVFLLSVNANWSDSNPSGGFKGFRTVMGEVVTTRQGHMSPSDHQELKEVVNRIESRRDQRNTFFHSTTLLHLTLQPRDTYAAFCDLFRFGELTIAGFANAVSAKPILSLYKILVELDNKYFTSDPAVRGKVDKILSGYKRNQSNVPSKGAMVTLFPQDFHMRMVCIDGAGGTQLKQQLQALL